MIESVGIGPGVILLGKYRILRKLGGGGMAEIYQAEHIQLGTLVAIKLPLGRHRTARGGARLLREAQVAASLDPDRVVRVLDIGLMEQGTPFIVLEYLEGRTLAEILADGGRLPVVDAVRWVTDACRGLAEAHARGIVHRDVKPSNLLIETRVHGADRLKLLDFGIATIRAAAEEEEEVATLTDSCTPIGSPPYMAPEQIRGSDVDARCDVWALGVTLYQLLTNRLPFKGSGSPLVAAILSDSPAPIARADVPRKLEQIIERCLSKDPTRRPGDAAELLSILDSDAEPAPLGATKRSRRWLSVAGVVGALGLAAASWHGGRSSASTAPTREPSPPRPTLEIGPAAAGGIANAAPSSSEPAVSPALSADRTQASAGDPGTTIPPKARAPVGAGVGPSGDAKPPLASPASGAAPSNLPSKAPTALAPNVLPSASLLDEQRF